jgi:hypothetical protein
MQSNAKQSVPQTEVLLPLGEPMTGLIGTQERWHEGYAIGLSGCHIEDDWGGYPSQFAAGWDVGFAVWRRINSYWGA